MARAGAGCRPSASSPPRSTSSCPATAPSASRTLRQWHAQSENPIDFAAFCRGEHLASGRERLSADMLNWVLYPDDSTHAGREMRLKQEFLLVSASLQDMLARHLREGRALHDFGRQNAVHLNDTHPALVPVELMRLLDRRARPGMGRSLDDRAAGGELHQPHADARGARDLGDRAVRGAAAAPHGDRLRDQPALPRRDPLALPGRRRPGAAPVADRRRRRAARAHGEPVGAGVAQGQRRVGTALAT